MMQLIISEYDRGYSFSYVVLENKKQIFKCRSEVDLRCYGLYDEEWHWFSEKLINKDNDKIQFLDLIIVCEDGDIKTFVKGKDY